MTRDELILATRQLIAEGDRLIASPSLASLQMWIQRSDDLLSTAWGNMDRYHLAWLMVGKPKGIVRGRAMTRDEEAAYVREVAAQKTAALQMSLEAADRQGMPFVGETGGRGARRQGTGDVGDQAAAEVGEQATADGEGQAAAGRPVDRAPDRAGLPVDTGLGERLAEARRNADRHRDHDEKRAPRSDRMER